MGEPLAELRLFPSGSRTDITLTKENKKTISQWGNPLQNSGCYQNKEKNDISVGEPLLKFQFLPSVSGTDTTLTKENY